MKFQMLTLLATLVCAFSYAADVSDKTTGEIFPSHVSFEHAGKKYELDATGVATRKKLIVSVYSVASYLQTGAPQSQDKFATILQDDYAKQLTIKWVRTVESVKVQEGYNESFKNALSADDYAKLEADINTFIGLFPNEVKKGEEHIIRWAPGGYVEVQINGKTVGSVTNKDFAKGLWKIWFGDKSVVDRTKLVSFMK